MAIIKRIEKGSKLTYEEMDNNFDELDQRAASTIEQKTLLENIGEDEGGNPTWKGDTFTGTGLLEAPIDDGIYGRSEGEWIDLNELLNQDIGMVEKPTLTYIDGNNQITVGEGIAFLCKFAEFNQNVKGRRVIVPERTFTITDQLVTHYLIAYRAENGDVSYEMTLNRDLLAHPNITTVAVVLLTGTTWHVAEFEALANGLPEKLDHLLILRDGFRKVSGLGMSDGGLVLYIEEGYAHYGASIKELSECDSVTDGIRFYTGNNHTFSLTNYLNNTQYDNGTSLVNLTNGRYNVNWIWRGVETQKHIYSVLSRSQFNSLSEALAAPYIPPPSYVADHAVFLGGVICQQGNPNAVAYIDYTRSNGTIVNSVPHNDLGGLQGGEANERYHLTYAEYQAVLALINP